MIPLSYRLRERVRIVEEGGVWHATCDLPLTALTVNEGAARLLRYTVDGASICELAARLATDEERILRLCEYFRGKGLLDIEVDDTVCVLPTVSIIVPTKDRAVELADCLTALLSLDYPRELVEVIVVDDGSADDTVETVGRFSCRLIVNDSNRGQSYSRNVAAAQATGEILAFTDSDCVADERWLRDLVPFFAWQRIVAVGGRVDNYYTSSRLDRYEETASSLNMGRRLLISLNGKDSFYVPTCNLLVRRDAFMALGGIREDMRVGEDVDLCWRLRAEAGYMIYSPSGLIRHKHRNRFGAMLRRRSQYGTSEAPLSVLHPDRRKLLPLPTLPFLTLVAVAAGALTWQLWLLPVTAFPCVWDATRRVLRMRRQGISVQGSRAVFSVARGHLSLIYYVLFHLVRYHLVWLLFLGVLIPRLWLALALALLYTSVVDYSIQRPRLAYPAFLVYYVSEHVAYQLGVLLGCLRKHTLRPYRLSFRTGERLTSRAVPEPSSGVAPSSLTPAR